VRNPQQKTEPLSVRCTPEIREWIASEAEKHFRSQSAQVLIILKERMDQQADKEAC
jgi:hypothetical protein